MILEASLGHQSCISLKDMAEKFARSGTIDGVFGAKQASCAEVPDLAIAFSNILLHDRGLMVKPGIGY